MKDPETSFRISEKMELGRLATFIPNKNLPVYNWFYYKEGFSREFVFEMANEFRLEPGKAVLEPFCGSGTTPLACKQMGINSFGFDVLPMAIFVSRVKTGDYDIEKIKDASKKIIKLKPNPGKMEIRVSNFLRKSFLPFTLEDIIFFRSQVNQLEDASTREFMLLALMDSAMKCSLVMKDGACLKRVNKHVPPLREMLRRRISIMTRDLEGFETKPCSTKICYGDARNIALEDDSVDAIITSPPYLNKIEYTNIYRIEEELFLPREENPGIRCFVGVDESHLDEKRFSDINFDIPLSAKPYFSDMNQAISEMFRVCKTGARIALVVGDGYLQEQVVDSGLILSMLAQKIGFKVNEIVVMNKRIATTPSRHRIGEMKESMLLWEKE